MFLKKKEITICDVTIAVSELTALQRAEYFELLVQQNNETANLEDHARVAKLNRHGVEQLAWVVSRSIWNTDRNRDVETIYQEILDSWGESALKSAFDIVSELSGMTSKDSDSNNVDEQKVESLEK
ncbi:MULTISPECIES: phage tail assembly chaperone G [Providencia]|uniref:Phage minor tail protein G n=2 Tax=Providencia TaxID=586 RepID=A0AA42K1S4_9GAMM|nr:MULTISPECIES: phage minor tail protein G [Providencia]MDG4695675.1 phage minor tail protein G [Providencia sp. CRE-3FA-0001]MDT0133120.1 phage minor tail protein G [Providencia huaxiensis]MDT1979526.1 phage minor tail protein G [Providencia huaxiensis]